MSENKYYFVDLIWNPQVYISYLAESQIQYIEDTFNIQMDINDYDVVIDEGILYPHEAYDIPTIENYDALVKFLDDNGYIQKNVYFLNLGLVVYTREDIIKRFNTWKDEL